MARPRAWLGLAAFTLGLVTAQAQTTQWVQSSIVAATAASFDMTVYGGSTYVAYESGGNVYTTSKSYGSTSWSAPSLVGSGTGPTIAIVGGNVTVAYLSGGVNVATYTGSSWANTNIGDINGSQHIMLRTDGVGTAYLFNQGGGTGGRGSLDITSYNGTSWNAPTNLAYGWYDSGSGNYYHQGIMATASNAAGYRLAYEADNWGGRVSWSSSSFTTSGFGAETGAGFPGYQSGGTLYNSSLAYTATNALFGYTMSGVGYVNSFDGTSWSGATSLGAADSMAVDPTINTFVVYTTGGNLMYWDGSSSSSISVLGTPLTGSSPLLIGDGIYTENLLYINGSGQLASAIAVPEPATYAGLCGAAALGLGLLRRRRR